METGGSTQIWAVHDAIFFSNWIINDVDMKRTTAHPNRLKHKDKLWRARVMYVAAHVHIVVTLVRGDFLADAYLTFVTPTNLYSSKIKWDSPQIKPKNYLLWIALQNNRTRSAKSIKVEAYNLSSSISSTLATITFCSGMLCFYSTADGNHLFL